MMLYMGTEARKTFDLFRGEVGGAMRGEDGGGRGEDGGAMREAAELYIV